MARRSQQAGEYVCWPECSEAVCRFAVEEDETYYNDDLRARPELTDESGQCLWSARHEVFGNVGVVIGVKVESNIRYQGQYEDSETGLFYNNFRYYDPDVGRYITQDPVGLLGGTNAYSYVDSPTIDID